MRVDFACSDTGKMLQTTEAPGRLQAAHVYSRIPQNLTGPTAEGTRIKTVGELAALLRNDRHHRREVNIKPQHPENFAGDAPQGSYPGQITMLANRARRWHGWKNIPQPID